MDLAQYRLIHLIGVVVVMVALGAAVATTKGSPGRGLAMALHGLGLLALLVAGFGMLAKLNAANPNYGYPNWMWAKVGIWAVLAFLPAVVKGGKLGVGLAVLLAALLGGGAVYLVTMKPF